MNSNLHPSADATRITEMTVIPIACPDPPLLNHHGVHEPMYRRVVIRLRAADGSEGLGEGPGGALDVRQLEAAAISSQVPR